MASFGTKLRVLRESKRLTQTKAAELLHLGNKTLSDYERGVSQPDLDTLKKIAALYEVSLDYLIGADDKKIFPDEEDDFQFALYDKVKDLTEEQKQDLMKIIEILKKQK